MNNKLFSTNFSIHYYLTNGSHAINSSTLYKSQEELLFLIKEIANSFSIDLRVKVTPSTNGGFIHVLNFLGGNAAALTLVSTIIAAMLGGSAWLVYQRPILNQQSEINNQQKQINTQQIEKNRIEIEKVKIELESLQKEAASNNSSKKSQISNNNNLLLNLEDSLDTEGLLIVLKDNNKIIKRVSNFYESVSNDEDVTSMGYKKSGDFSEIIVSRDFFDGFIINEKLLDDLIINNATIEITSPVLNKRSNKWHGIFDEKNIAFSISDSLFKESVLSKKITFMNGSKISCSLRILRRTNKAGEIENYEYNAENIFLLPFI